MREELKGRGAKAEEGAEQSSHSESDEKRGTERMATSELRKRPRKRREVDEIRMNNGFHPHRLLGVHSFIRITYRRCTRVPHCSQFPNFVPQETIEILILIKLGS